MSFKQAIKSKQGYIEQKKNQYYLLIGGISKTFDLNGNIKAFNSTADILFPNRIYVEIILINLYPNAQIYFDQDPIGITDQSFYN